ncbi:MAG: calcium-binding protein [Pseudomonadota bacterium]
MPQTNETQLDANRETHGHVGLTTGQTLVGGDGIDTLQYNQDHEITITSTEGDLKSGYVSNDDGIVVYFENMEILEPVKVDPDQVDGSNADDTMGVGFEDSDGNVIGGADGIVDKINGHEGSDTINAGAGNDLAAGDTVGNEWSLVDGKWVYDASKVSAIGKAKSFDDVINGGEGDDVLLGNGGNDKLFGEAGQDIINAGTGDDEAFGGADDDLINLEDGDDFGSGGLGADIINAGKGDDIVYGDLSPVENLVTTTTDVGLSVAQYDDTDWNVVENAETGHTEMHQTLQTDAQGTYTITVDVAANLAAGATQGAVEILWDGVVIDKVEVESGVFQTKSYEVSGTGGETGLTIRTAEYEGDSGSNIDTSGAIFKYETSIDLGEGEITVDAFAPGQAKLFQVIDGQLKVFDTETSTYQDAGDPTGIKINAIGLNIENDLIYGIAKTQGVDTLGNPVAVPDIVMMDANGEIYRVGDGHYGDYVGDFDGEGNLWTFHTSTNRVTKIDVDKLDADGNPQIETFHFPADISTDRLYDVAYNPETQEFYGVVAPSKQGGEGTVLKIDLSQVETGGEPVFTEIPITDSIMNDALLNGMVKGAYGAVFMDGSGNLYAGLNKGDHDMSTSTDVSGGIYKIDISEDGSYAVAELMADAQTTGANDGAMDTRANDPFADVDASADVLLKNITVTPAEGGNDSLRGGEGDDTIFGGQGDDEVFGGKDNDTIDGEEGNDKVFGGEGDDLAAGGEGDDYVDGGLGNDTVDGGAGIDTVLGGSGDDIVSGGAGNDKIVGGSGADTIHMGEGNDHVWGGQWSSDNSTDTFVLSAGSGKDMIHDFDTEKDLIDLSEYGITYEDLTALITDHGWATEIDLAGLPGASDGDRLFLKSVESDTLDESNFIF